MMGEKSTTLLANERGLPAELNKLLREHMYGRVGGHDMTRLLNLLRSTECDLQQPLPVRFAVGCLLISIELKIGGRGRSKTPEVAPSPRE